MCSGDCQLVITAILTRVINLVGGTVVEFTRYFEFKVAGEVIDAFELEFRRDERVMRYLTVKLDKHAIEWAEKRRAKLNTKKA